MREVTVKDLVAAFEGVLVDVNPSDNYGFSFEMSKARVEYDEEYGELSFTTGNYNHDGIGTVTFKVEECLEGVGLDEVTGEYVISFTCNIPDVTVKKFKSIEELKAEHVQKRRRNFAVIK